MRKFIIDNLKFLTCIIAGILSLFYGYQYFFQNYDITVLIRCVFWFSYIPIVLIFGMKAVSYLFFIVVNALIFSLDYRNYTLFFILLLFSFFKPKAKLIIFPLYVFEIILVDHFHANRDVINLIIHLLVCSFFAVFAMVLQLEYYKSKKLDITDDEKRILEELAAGKKQKEIDFFNKNTVSDKLKAARIRNNCGTTTELTILYIINKQLGRNPIS